MQQLLSINVIMMIGGGLLVLLILLIILLVASGKKTKSVVQQAEYDYDDYGDGEPNRSEQLRLPNNASADSLFRDENLARLVAATLNVRTSDVIDARKLSQIRRLDGTGKDIHSLEGIELLQNLEIVNLGSNRLTELPKEIKRLDRLQELRVDNNAIHDFSVLSGNRSLKTLDISDNDIDHLPDDIFVLPQLEKFAAQRNRISHLPSEMMSAPSKIQELDLSQNALRTIPGTIRNMTNLSLLNLAGNQLTQIPLEIGSLERMRKLDVSRNASLIIPDGLRQKLIARAVDVREDSQGGQLLGTQLESFDIIDNNDGFVKFGETQADDGGLDDMKNTYIDLTNSNEDLLNEIAALEKSLSDTSPIGRENSQVRKPSQNREGETVQNSISDRVNNLGPKQMGQMGQVGSQGYGQGDNMQGIQQGVNGGLAQQMNELQRAELEKKEKRKRMLKIAGMVAGATLAAVTITGTSVYLMNRNGSKRKRRRKNGYSFMKKRR